MGFFDKIDNVSAAATLSKRSFKDRLQNNDCRNKCIFERSLKVNKYCARGNVERYTVPDNTDTHSWISFKRIFINSTILLNVHPHGSWNPGKVS